MKKLSILMVNYNGLEHLAECFGSIFAQIGDASVIVVVMIVNASLYESIAWTAEHYPQVKVVASDQNLGFAEGNNFGAQFCSGEWLFLLNNDTVLAENCLAELRKAVASYPGHILACMMLNYHDRNLVDSAGDYFYRSGPSFSRRNISAQHPTFANDSPVFSACGGALVIEKSLFEHLQGFDEDLFLNFEDMDLCMRARAQGNEIMLVPHAQILHKGSATIGHYTRTSVYYSVRNQFLVRVKNYPWTVLLRCTPGHIFTASLALLKIIKNGAFKWWIQARRDQIKMLPRFVGKRKHNPILAAPEFRNWLRPNWLGDYWKRTRGKTLEP